MRKYVLLNGSGIKSMLNAKPSARHVNTVANAGAKITIAILSGKINLFMISVFSFTIILFFILKYFSCQVNR